MLVTVVIICLAFMIGYLSAHFEILSHLSEIYEFENIKQKVRTKQITLLSITGTADFIIGRTLSYFHRLHRSTFGKNC